MIAHPSKLTPGGQRTASGNDVLRERGSLSATPSHAGRAEETGRDGRPVPPTQRDLVTASLNAVHHPDVYRLRRIPGSPRHA